LQQGHSHRPHSLSSSWECTHPSHGGSSLPIFPQPTFPIDAAAPVSCTLVAPAPSHGAVRPPVSYLPTPYLPHDTFPLSLSSQPWTPLAVSSLQPSPSPSPSMLSSRPGLHQQLAQHRAPSSPAWRPASVARPPRPAASSSFPLAMNAVDPLLQFLHVVWSSTARVTCSWLWETSEPLLTT
jgi:hypothetical protein